MAYRLLLVVLLAAAGGYLALARRIPLDVFSAEELVNSRTLPTAYAALLAVTLALLLLRPPPHVRFPRHVAQSAALLALSVVFVALVPHLGVWVALGMLLVAAFPVMGERRALPVIGLGVGIPLAGWFAVERLLGIYVPGPWS